MQHVMYWPMMLSNPLQCCADRLKDLAASAQAHCQRFVIVEFIPPDKPHQMVGLRVQWDNPERGDLMSHFAM